MSTSVIVSGARIPIGRLLCVGVAAPCGNDGRRDAQLVRIPCTKAIPA
ncbi:hypothetical protein [Nocardioides sp. AN3]